MIPTEQNIQSGFPISTGVPLLNVVPAHIISDLGQTNSRLFPTDSSITPSPASTSISAFELSLANKPLPSPGPSYYAARRALWLAPTSEAPLPPVPSPSRQRLEHLLSIPGAVENDVVWKSGVEKVWRGLVSGGRLKRRLPMNLVVSKPIPTHALGSACVFLVDQNHPCRMAT